MTGVIVVVARGGDMGRLCSTKTKNVLVIVPAVNRDGSSLCHSPDPKLRRGKGGGVTVARVLSYF